MPKTCCCVPCCSERGGHVFPKEKTLRNAWISAIKRNAVERKFAKWVPTKCSVVCSGHFTDADYKSETTYGTSPLRKQLRDGAVPSVFKWTPVKSSEYADARAKRLCVRRSKQDEVKREHLDQYSKPDAEPTDICPTAAEELYFETDPSSDLNVAYEECVNDESISVTTSQEDVTVTTCMSNVHTQTPHLPILSVDQFVKDDAGILFYTGLSTYTDFKTVLACLGDCVNHLNYLYNHVENVSIENQLFLTLIKLRRNKTNFELSRLFNISETSVANIWITWVNFMYRQWQEIQWWPERDIVRYFCPTDFRSKFPTTRVIVDGTECPVKKPRPPVAQQSTYSTYKNRNTIKVLVGTTPGGLVSYISPAYGGSVSDRQIVERSNLTRICDPGDSIMADKGFNVQDLFAVRDVAINIPTFFRKKNRMTGKVVLRDRKISSKRVHVERIIGLAKTFKILAAPMNNTQTKLSSEITFVCFMLCNFSQCQFKDITMFTANVI
ncbi:uncharacterized protein [Argopecten irradians]|uniref:uncharacterized protein n=1 Tax=Argopecten irradians TaxID=31199 RepID=UPI00371B8243